MSKHKATTPSTSKPVKRPSKKLNGDLHENKTSSCPIKPNSSMKTVTITAIATTTPTPTVRIPKSKNKDKKKKSKKQSNGQGHQITGQIENVTDIQVDESIDLDGTMNVEELPSLSDQDSSDDDDDDDENDNDNMDMEDELQLDRIVMKLVKGKKGLVSHARMMSMQNNEQESDEEDEEMENEKESDNEKKLIRKIKSLTKVSKNNENIDKNQKIKTIKDQSTKASSSEVFRRMAKQRVLLLSSRGITTRYRHLLKDLDSLLPHAKRDAKHDSKSNLDLLNELCELHSCNNCMYFDIRRGTDLFMWLSKAPNGPSVKFEVLNVHTMDEMKMTGNHLKWSRPILSFDKAFDDAPHFQLLKEILKQIFNTPRGARKSKPFFDHVLSFTLADDKIWFRNHQITESSPKGISLKPNSVLNECTLTEVGPRFVLDPIKIFRGSFGGQGIWENQKYTTPAAVRRAVKHEKSDRYTERITKKGDWAAKKIETQLPEDPLSVKQVFK